MATLSTLADRLRSELGDFAKSFVWSTTADGITNRYLIPYSPIDGASLVVHVNGSDVSNAVVVEEETGYIIFDTTPPTGNPIVVAGTYFRYFTNLEIFQFINDSFAQHSTNHADEYGRPFSLATLPGLEEYPVVIYASTLALYTLATDASFDIDITAPDGVQIPRSERYRQLMQMIETRKQQYKEICSQLGIGLYRIDVFSLRRISKTTNYYVPIYLPQEVDDRSMPQRAILDMPTYGSAASPSNVPTYDILMYQGDSFEVTLQFSFDTSGYIWKSQMTQVFGDGLPIETFTITPVDGDNTKLTLSLTSTQTLMLPQRCWWDIQATTTDDPDYEQTYMRGSVTVTPQATL